MGRKMLPAFGIAWKAIGSTTQRAAHMAATMRFFVRCILIVN